MPQIPDNVIGDTRGNIAQVIAYIEQAQAIAAKTVQQWNKLGGATSVSGFDWNTLNVTEQEFLDAVSSLSTALPDIMGAHGTNLYKVLL